MKSDKDKIIDTLNKMFSYADQELWSKLENEVFSENNYIDIASINGIKGYFNAAEAIELWKNFAGNLDGIHRELSEIIVTVNDNKAELFTSATLSHIKKNSPKGILREYIGNYRLKFEKIDEDWVINSFIYTIDHQEGNLTFE